MSELTASVAGWLNRPYLDLGPAPDEVPNHTAALVVDCRSLFGGEDTPWFWSSLNPSFREALTAEVGLPGYAVDDPTLLPTELRTPNWQQLCEYLANFTSLDPATQVKVGRMLNRMCFFRHTRALIPADIGARAGERPELAFLAWLRAMAGYKLWLEDADPTYSLAEFELLAQTAPPGLARINPRYQMVVQNVKHGADLAATEHWQRLHHAAIEEARDDLDPHDYLMATSRSYRVAAFIPQMRRDAEGTVRDMDLAEQYAERMDVGTELQRKFAREMQYPVQESRIKEAQWIGDLDLALERAKRHRDDHLVDARTWLHCGQVHVKRDELEEALGCFRECVRLAPPGGEVARFLAGQCHEALGDLNAALDSYLGALRVDPLGISSVDGVQRVAKALGSKVHSWAERRMEQLDEMRAQRAAASAAGDDAYRHLPAPQLAR